MNQSIRNDNVPRKGAHRNDTKTATLSHHVSDPALNSSFPDVLRGLKLVIVCDNALRHTKSESEIPVALKVPPLRNVKRMDLKKLNSARRRRKQHDDFVQQQMDSGCLNSPSTLYVPSSPSRWDSLPCEKAALSNATNRFSQSRESFNSLPGGILSSPTKKRVMHAVSSSMPLSYFHQQNSGSSIRSPVKSSEKISSLLLQVSPHRTLASSPVRMPVRKNSFDQQPRQPTRYHGGDSTSSVHSSRSTTMSILDEALSVCDLCSEDDYSCPVSDSNSEISDNKEASLGSVTGERESLFVEMMPIFPSLT